MGIRPYRAASLALRAVTMRSPPHIGAPTTPRLESTSGSCCLAKPALARVAPRSLDVPRPRRRRVTGGKRPLAHLVDGGPRGVPLLHPHLVDRSGGRLRFAGVCFAHGLQSDPRSSLSQWSRRSTSLAFCGGLALRREVLCPWRRPTNRPVAARARAGEGRGWRPRHGVAGRRRMHVRADVKRRPPRRA